ncbi:hypothetical protein TNCV_3951781 [Trichonephila clavipes]|nr:hypothetical protein TNCV_3951781 [Trichonephila clavipes]
MVNGDKKCVTYDNTGQKRSWSNLVEAAQTVVNPGLIARKNLGAFGNIDLPGLFLNIQTHVSSSGEEAEHRNYVVSIDIRP